MKKLLLRTIIVICLTACFSCRPELAGMASVNAFSDRHYELREYSTHKQTHPLELAADYHYLFLAENLDDSGKQTSENGRYHFQFLNKGKTLTRAADFSILSWDINNSRRTREVLIIQVADYKSLRMTSHRKDDKTVRLEVSNLIEGAYDPAKDTATYVYEPINPF